MVKPPFSRQGNKTPILPDILKLIPPHKTYCELFAGSAVVFFNKKKSEKNILNDLDKEVYDRLKLLQEAPLDLSQYKNNLNNLEDLHSFYIIPPQTIPDKILHSKITSSNGYRGKPIYNSKIYKKYNPFSITKKLPFYKDMMNDVIVTNKDYLPILKKYDSVDSFFFIDPPYENTHGGFYSHSNFDYKFLADILQNIQGLFLLTMNDSENIRQLFKDFFITEIDVVTSWNGKDYKHTIRKELLITNRQYSPACATECANYPSNPIAPSGISAGQ